MNKRLDNRPVHLYFDRELSEIKCREDCGEILDSLPRKVVFCTSWDTLPSLLKERPLH